MPAHGAEDAPPPSPRGAGVSPGEGTGAVRWAAPVLSVLLAAGSLLLGALAADPVPLVAELSRRRLLLRGAHEETFSAKDGRSLSTLVLGPLSAERPVVLLHGLGATGSYWERTAAALRAKGRTVILPDGPGSGRSQAPADASGWGIPARVAALDALVAALGLDRPAGGPSSGRRFDLVGHSLGGWTAGAFALARPHALASLVLVDAGGFTPVPPERYEAVRGELSPVDRGGGRALYGRLFHRNPYPLPPFASMPGFVFDSLARNYRAPNVTRTLSSLDEKDALLGREHLLPRGTTLIWGERETLFPLADARRAAARIPEATLLVVTGVGHDGPLEAPDAFFSALERALSRPER